MSQSLLPSPIGNISLAGDGTVLTAIRIGADGMPDEDCDDPLLREARAQLAAWFDGRLTAFDLPLAASSTPRGPAHRAAIMAIGHGETASYGSIARAIGSSPRAVGQACRANPFPILVPCHRVLGAGRSIGHYSAGSGVETKRWLLDHERERNSLWPR
ncbi:methylated-DNA--[protein]-cysteine S-methyltransferase [Sphingomonas profundi]|uniref:methylated-DNA--[protein]-cysteine S-methyltransferase n=1 Tax=Alterirhizorhabdus profundi TaxID=2681549 RepID=UPI0012E948D1|nr:methylated-DNA--[protein]-cysteine S-methyltransferase [Sphingomonas profundi]